MAREILFRGKGAETGEWYYGNYLKMDKTAYCFAEDYAANPDNTEHFIVYDEMTDWGLPNTHKMVEVDPKTVGQYIGLLDKDNNKIFEDDILSFGDELILVYWDDEGFRWIAKKAVQYPCHEFPDKNWDRIDLGWIGAEVACTDKMTTQIIGNIHDNPESFIIEHDECADWEF